MKGRRKQPAKQDHFPYLVLAGVCIVALLASALLSGIRFGAPTENVVGGAYNQIESATICGKTIFIDDLDTPGKQELYSRTGNAQPVKLSGPLQAEGDVTSFDISKNGVYVVYTADASTDGTVELYSVPLAGGAVTKISAPLDFFENVISYVISNDGTHVAYSDDSRLDQMYELYIIPITGGIRTQLSHTLPADHDIEGYLFSPDDQRVIYRVVRTAIGKGELYSVASTGGSTTLISQGWNPPAYVDIGFNVDELSAVISCNSQTVTYLADTLADGSADELYSVAITGGVKTPLAGHTLPTLNCPAVTLTCGGGNTNTAPHVFIDDLDTPGQNELYSENMATGVVTKISGPLHPDGDVWAFNITPDGQKVVFIADDLTVTTVRNELFIVPITGGLIQKLSQQVSNPDPNAEKANVVWFAISPDGARVAYTADLLEWTQYDLYSVPITGGASTHLNIPLMSDHDVDRFMFSPNSQRVIYAAGRNTVGDFWLYSVPSSGGTAVRISQVEKSILRAGPATRTFDVSCDSQTAYYLTQTAGGPIEAYSVPILGGAFTPLTDNTLPTITCTNVCTANGGTCSANANCCSSTCTAGVCATPPVDPNTPSGYAPAIDPINGQQYLSVTTGSSGVSVTANGGTGRYIWRYGYYLKDNQWNRFELATSGVLGSNWTNSTLNVVLPSDAPSNGYVIIYSCKKYTVGGPFICGPRTATQAANVRYWTISSYGTSGQCQDECETGSTTCSGTSGVRTCGNYDTDTCRDWSPTPTACTGGTTCANGVCGTGGGGNNQLYCRQQSRTVCTTSTDQPTNSVRITASCPQCEHAGGGTSCGYVTNCYQCPEEGQVMQYDTTLRHWVCSGSTTCTDECTTAGATQCGPGGASICGNSDADSCLEWSTPTPCVAPNACTSATGVCAPNGQPSVCNQWDRRCTGNTVQVCTIRNNALTWVDELVCSGGNVCTTPSTQTTPKSAFCGSAGGTCTGPTSNGFWMGGDYHQCSTPSPAGSCWDNANRTMLGHEAICCNAATQCAWSTLCFDQERVITNDQNFDYLCSNKGQGPTWFSCSHAHNGETFTSASGQQWCCRNNRFTTGICTITP